MEDKIVILPINPETFSVEDYSQEDINLISFDQLDTNFSSSTDYVEYYVYDEGKEIIFPNSYQPLEDFKIRDGHVFVDPSNDLINLDFDEGNYYINYCFYRQHLNSSFYTPYYISQISSDRTEIKLSSNSISSDLIKEGFEKFTKYRDEKDYFVDFYLNFGQNNLVVANNLRILEEGDEVSILIKLYNPLPSNFILKNQCWVVENISEKKGFEVKFPVSTFEIEDFTYIAGPNLSLNVKDESGVDSTSVDYNTLISSNLTSSQSELQSILKNKGININVNYESYPEFIKFSSAKTRLENFYYKVGLIESYNNSITDLYDVQSQTTASSAFSSSLANYRGKRDNIINNFDGYEKFLYFTSGSVYTYPKSNTSKPYKLHSTGSSEVLNWLGNATPGHEYYGGQALSASNYDQDNQDWLYWAIPEYLRDDSENRNYELFLDMVGQHFDNVWIYSKDIVNKFNADNRLDYGISKDLVADAIRDFGVKLYSNNFNTNDLYEAFLGITPNGNIFPSTGSEQINTLISASNNPIPLDEANKRLYKRIYHNIPYLLKTKGTVAGLRALITSYGIPSSILEVNEFGDQNLNVSQNYEYEQDIFNYKLEVGPNSYFSSSFDLNGSFANTTPKTVQFRFKTSGVPSSTTKQTLFSADGNQALITLEYTGSSNSSGSYSGSISELEKEYGTVKFYPRGNIANAPSASVYLPVFDGGWWSVMTTLDYDESTDNVSLFVGNKTNNQIKWKQKDTISANGSAYNIATKAYLPYTASWSGHTAFSGSLQEIRYYSPVLNSSSFDDYIMNPFSYVGNSRNSVPDELAFRASLGALLDKDRRVSIHPKITGSYVTQSFASDSDYYISNASFTTNNETVYYNQPSFGVKNRINDKITIVNNTIPSGSTLSALQTLDQTKKLPDNKTPNSNYLEVGFSPTNQVDSDIINHLGNFDLGEYIGDPRTSENDDKNYPDLDKLRDSYFEKYIKGYNVKDFIRLIKYFDNSLFKMIKDFTPARTGLSSGVVVKQHLLERNKQRRAKVSFLDQQHTGSLKPHVQNFNTGSLHTEEGGGGGTFNRFGGINFHPDGEDGLGSNNIFGVEQSFEENRPTQYGESIYIRDDQREFYNGEFSGSDERVKLQRGLGVYEEDPCFAYYSRNGIPQYLYRMSFLSGSDDLFTITSTGSIPPFFTVDDIIYKHSASFDVNYLGDIQYIETSNVIISGTINYVDAVGARPFEFYNITGSDVFRTASFTIRVPNQPNKYRNYNQLLLITTHSLQESGSNLEFSMITGSAENSASGFEVNVNGNITVPTVETGSIFNVVYSESVNNNYYYAITSSLTRTAHITASVPDGWLNSGLLISGSVTDPQEAVFLTFVYLGYNLNILNEACSNIDARYRLDSTYLADASAVYTETNDPVTGRILRASAGYYSDGNIVRYWDGLNFGRTERCSLNS